MISSVWKHEQDITDEGILNLFPEHVRELLNAIIQENFILTLVGGGVRDYFLTGAFSKDFDFELRHSHQYNEQDWACRIDHLKENLQKRYGNLGHKIEFLSFSIMRIGWEDHEEEIELAPARIESYTNTQGFGHSDMDVSLVSNGVYAQTFSRRDFTLNAMGIEFSKKEANILVHFIDPFSGRKDLLAKELVPCGANFSKDPVRFCRGLRFSLKYNFKFSQQLCNSCKSFNLIQLSAFYFFKEGFKVDFFRFVVSFFDWTQRLKLPLSQDLRDLEFLAKIGKYNLSLSTPEEVLLFLIYQKGSQGQLKADYVCVKDIKHFVKVAKLKSSLIDIHINLRTAVEELECFAPADINSDIRKLSFSEFLNYPHKGALKSFHRIINRYDNREQLFLILRRINPSLSNTMVRYSTLLPVTLSGKVEFQKMINEQGLTKELRSDALYYCHFRYLA